MGVETNAYSIPPKMMRKIRANNDNLSFILDIPEEGGNPEWSVESYCMGSVLPDTLSILKAGGFKKTAKILDLENYFYNDDSSNIIDYDGYDIWVISPSKVKTVSKELEPATFEYLKTNGLAHQVTGYRDGAVIHEDMYSYHIGDIEELKDFFKKTMELGHYLLFVEA